MSFGDFSLIPADDPQSSPADDLAAAVEGALAIADAPQPIAETPPQPFGRTWRFDWESGQFVRQGQSPFEVTGLEAVAEWCQMAARTARFAHPVFSDDFGTEAPDSVIGSLVDDEVLADWREHITEALLVHERISSVENIALRWDPAEGVLYIDGMDIVTDDEQTVTVGSVTIQTGGAQ